MYQVLEDIKTGKIVATEVPVPQTLANSVTVRSAASLISAGTERMLLEFGKSGWVGKAHQQPDKVKQALEKIRTDGIMPTVEAVRSKLEKPLPLGYSNVGTVHEVGTGTTEFKIGDRVVSNGYHAEYVNVPVNLCARIPENVDYSEAVYTVPAAIALQGIRLAQPTIGELFVVTGLGLIGQLAVQLLIANGCRVLGVDMDETRRKLAEMSGAFVADPDHDDVLAITHKLTQGRGVDGVILTVATDSDKPIQQAARMCRKRGRIVLIGVTGLNLSRSDFYEKELTFQVSCSYGPGRYDPNYESKSQDYPIGFVRWTARRNFEAVLDLMASGRIKTEHLTTHRFTIDRASDAYELLEKKKSYLGILLQYPNVSEKKTESSARFLSLECQTEIEKGKPVAAFLGAGNHAGQVLIPAFKACGVRFSTIVSLSGVSATRLGKKYEFGQVGSDPDVCIQDSAANIVVISTRHDTHAEFVCAALRVGKHVFVEKPLALSLQELDEIETVYKSCQRSSKSLLLMVGFNRRYAPLVTRMKSLLDGISAPKSFIVTINAGAIDVDHWVHDRQIGGGRIIGEVCHFVDLLRFLSGSRITCHNRISVKEFETYKDDISTINLEFADGSTGAIHYLANGNRAYPKERVEVFSQGRVLQLDNFKLLRGWGWHGFRKQRVWRQDKGQRHCVAAFLDSVQQGNGYKLISFDELLEVSRTTIEIAEGIQRFDH